MSMDTLCKKKWVVVGTLNSLSLNQGVVVEEPVSQGCAQRKRRPVDVHAGQEVAVVKRGQ
ncbi:hypothetical protein FIM25_14890 [Desulfobotulus mexicanus]|uniref:Uncharacterized protein n=1 Tax=Desulfobotulus mexicanus TaxID=2586642 RepID=A0A5S5MCS7_9BACT|nr:hypothetical protein FIM25_14890 [Desulfobotulus mexicanus]